MAMKLSAGNLFKFFTLIAPFLLMFTFTLIAFIDLEPQRAIMYIGLVTLATSLIGLIPIPGGDDKNKPSNPLCKLWDIPYLNEARPSLSLTFISFTLMYMLMPMLFSGNLNFPILVLLLILLIADYVSNTIASNCITHTNGAVAIILGSIASALFTSLIYVMPMSEKLLYFSRVPSNKVFCSRPSKQSFRCSVYRNGKLIQNIN